MAQIEFGCKDVVFHFNKKHLEDETIPMWVLKFHGETYYVNHVDDDNNATLAPLTFFDRIRLRNQRLGITRIMFKPNCEMHKALRAKEFKHSSFKIIAGACTSTFIVCDLLEKDDVPFALLKYTDFRILQPNERYYKEYDEVRGGRIEADYSDPDTPYEYS